MTKNAYLAAVIVMFLVGCREDRLRHDRLDIPEDLTALRQNALRCSRDVESVPVQHSEHCVYVAENIRDAYREDCLGDAGYACMNHQLVLSDIYSIYQSAIIDGLIAYGTDGLLASDEKEQLFPRDIYLQGESMRKMFDDCLQSEAENLGKMGLQPVSIVSWNGLDEGQECFRMNYPDFRTRSITSL